MKARGTAPPPHGGALTTTSPTGGAVADRVGMWGDGLALGTSALLTSGAGLIGWLLATRLMTVEDVGVASAYVNSFLLVGAVAELGLGPALLRWLPRAGDRRGTLLRRVYLTVVPAAAVIALIWGLAVGPTLQAAVPTVAVAVFVLSGVIWTLKQLQDQVLTGLGAARWVPWENLLFSIARLAVLWVAAPTLGATAMVLSWMLPAAAAVLVVTLWLPRRLRRVGSGPGALPDRAEVRRFVGPVYPAAVCTAVFYNVTPLLVTLTAGPATGAVFFVVWMGLCTIDLAAVGFVNAVVIRLATDPDRPGDLIRRSAGRLAALLVPGLVVGWFAAPWLLGLFGPTYADDGTTLLRLILLGLIPRVAVLLAVGVHQAAGRGLPMALLQAGSVLGTATGLWWVHEHALPVLGVTFLVAETVLALLAWGQLRRRAGRSA